MVDDPLPITIETTQKLFGEREKDFRAFLAAHREGIVHAKANREKAVQLLIDKFGHYRSLAERTFDDYLCYMDETLTVDVKQLSKLLAQVALQSNQNAREVAAEWLMAGALRS